MSAGMSRPSKGQNAIGQTAGQRHAASGYTQQKVDQVPWGFLEDLMSDPINHALNVRQLESAVFEYTRRTPSPPHGTGP